jgi:hypothetical protein
MGPNFIDGVALLAGLFWLGLIVLWGLSAGVSLLPAVEHGLVVSIFVYPVVYVGLYIIVRTALTSEEKRRAQARRRRAEGHGRTPREQPPESVQKQG